MEITYRKEDIEILAFTMERLADEKKIERLSDCKIKGSAHK